jgi:hypothetical protein
VIQILAANEASLRSQWGDIIRCLEYTTLCRLGVSQARPRSNLDRWRSELALLVTEHIGNASTTLLRARPVLPARTGVGCRERPKLDHGSPALAGTLVNLFAAASWA